MEFLGDALGGGLGLLGDTLGHALHRLPSAPDGLAGVLLGLVRNVGCLDGMDLFPYFGRADGTLLAGGRRNAVAAWSK